MLYSCGECEEISDSRWGRGNAEMPIYGAMNPVIENVISRLGELVGSDT